MNNILYAARIASGYHGSQTRKYTGVPYIVHPARVAARLTYYPKATEIGVCAAWLHDVLEDCPWVRPQDLMIGWPKQPPRAWFTGGGFDVDNEHLFCEHVVDLVLELTNPSKKHPELPRSERKKMDREHLQNASLQARLIKLIDRTDNLRDLAGASGDFVQVYGEESKLLLDVLRGTDEELEKEYVAALHGALKAVGRP